MKVSKEGASRILKLFNALPSLPVSIVAIMVAMLAIVVASNATNTAPPLVVTDDGPRYIVPESPGLVNALEVCEKGVKDSQEFGVIPPPSTPVYEYISEFGASKLRWVDSGNNRVAELDGSIVVLSDEVMQCFRKSR
jgi:hypothetical protein